MKILRKLSSIYVFGLGFLIMVILVAFFSFNDIYTSTEKILELTTSVAKRQPGFSQSETDRLQKFVEEIRYIRIRAYFFFTSTLLLVSAGIFYLVYVYKRNILEPLRSITSSTLEMLGGQIKTPPIMKGTEIGKLVENFNSMGQKLEEKIIELEESVRREQKVVRTLNILNEFASSIMFKLNVNDVLNTLISTNITLIKSEISTILLIDGQSRKITHFVSSLPEYSGDITGLAEKIIHELIDKGVPIRLSALSGNKRFDEIISRTNVKVNNLLAVPLIVKGEILGSLILVNKADSDEFLMTDEDMAMTVSFQAATAIEKSMLYEEIVQLAKTDGLTGLKNHRTFQEDLENEIKRARRLNKNFALLLIDIDYFKGLNDTYGHQEGDIVLKELSGILLKNVRNIDSVSRYGGEEFTIILPEATYDGGMRVAEKIRRDISEHVFNPRGSRGKLTVSIGVSTFPEDAIYREGLIKAADDALYMAKKMGRNKVVTFKQYRAEAAKTK